MDRFFDILALIIYLAIVATLVASPNTKSIISSFFSGFSGTIHSAMGH